MFSIKSLGVDRLLGLMGYQRIKPHFYEDVIRVTPTFKGMTLDEISETKNLGQIFSDDGKALSQNSKERDCHRLEERLVARVANTTTTQSYGSVVLNEAADRLSTTLEYIDLLKERFATDTKRIEQLRSAVLTAFISRVGENKAGYYIPEEEKPLYKRIIAERDLRRNGHNYPGNAQLSTTSRH